MSFKLNVIVNYTSQILVTLFGIVFIPQYIDILGPEGYGLIAFYTLLQSWFNLLDLGLTPTISRETVRNISGELDSNSYLKLYKVLNLFFLSSSLIITGLLVSNSGYFAEHWIKSEDIDVSIVAHCIAVMGIILSIRWLSSLNRGVLTGHERIIWLSIYNLVFSFLKFVGVFIVLIFIDNTIVTFFYYQLALSVIELLMLNYKVRTVMPIKSNNTINSKLDYKSIAKFSLSIALTGGIWVIVTQTDKLILSKLLSLEYFGYFTLAVLVANGVMILANPVGTALMPRLANLFMKGNNEEVKSVISYSTRVTVTLAGSAALVLIACSKHILFAWTNDINIANKVYLVLKLYAFGNLFLAFSAYSYYIQYGLGNVKYHLIGNLIFVVILVPLIGYFATSYGAIGAASVWGTLSFFYFVFWVSWVNHKIFPNFQISWILKDILYVIYPSSFITIAYICFSSEPTSRLNSFLQIFAFGIIVLSLNLIRSKLIKLPIFYQRSKSE
ncbi:lipopolysaccharide biosynthesis protein [Shewanella algae]|uniref:lipopolysaccharide biosynthesis protein n=1 Tax=Shewanella algae TaxID=38313 RepID=UPI0005CD9C00|nr:oligosaccharide flippase family protein [Shewanella algae]